ncbi:L-lactate dehydrogenase [Candidatus Saccharibacteria bacterium]|nr:L-lactate dehydrogenase [Candidatus Saccharibacteria bacterium]
MSKTAIKISVIGAGFVGSTTAYTLMAKGIASEIVLFDRKIERAEGEVMDIEHGSPFTAETLVRAAGNYDETKDSDIVIITAGAKQEPGETRLNMATKNAEIMRSIVSEVAPRSPQAILLIVTNPVDVMAYVAREVSGFPKSRVIGSGTNLDSARLRFTLSKKFGDIDSRDVHAYILGEHGDSEFPAWSLANIGGQNIDAAAAQFHVDLSESVKSELGDSIKNAAYEIINRKGATYYGIAMSVARICEAILRDERSIIPLSVLLNGEYGIDDVYLSVPVIVGEHGIEKILTPHLTDDEMGKLHNSANVLKEARAGLN